ncbi:MAG TPA: hypothetical protein VLC08_12655 [Chitinolyticbacter sp.]|nr:hypothetical protein [Chitinolyticbacter sp.]
MKHQQSHKDEYGPAPPREAIAESGKEGVDSVAEQTEGAVPLSASAQQDNQDYVRHYFGLERYRQWLGKARREVRTVTPGLQPASGRSAAPDPSSNQK